MCITAFLYPLTGMSFWSIQSNVILSHPLLSPQLTTPGNPFSREINTDLAPRNGNFHVLPYIFTLVSFIFFPYFSKTLFTLLCPLQFSFHFPSDQNLFTGRRCLRCCGCFAAWIGDSRLEEIRQIKASRWLRRANNHRYWSPKMRHCSSRSSGRHWQSYYQLPWRQGTRKISLSMCALLLYPC